jgi:hypothetical protein
MPFVRLGPFGVGQTSKSNALKLAAARKRGSGLLYNVEPPMDDG